MKIYLAIIVFSLILLYFIDAALKIENLNLEMATHNAVRFVTGFVVLGIWVWSKHRLKLKAAMYLVLALLISDDIFDYVRNINTLKFEFLIHDTVVLIWGALLGYFVTKDVKAKQVG